MMQAKDHHHRTDRRTRDKEASEARISCAASLRITRSSCSDIRMPTMTRHSTRAAWSLIGRFIHLLPEGCESSALAYQRLPRSSTAATTGSAASVLKATRPS